MKNKYEIVTFEDIEITADIEKLTKSACVYFNATEIADKFDKKTHEYLSNKSTVEYLEILKREFPSLEIVVIKRGKYGGTWMHQELALDFARWCSAEFRFRLDRWIKSRIKEESERKIARDKARLNHRPMTDAIQADHDNPKSYHYSNEADMINRITLGMTAKKFREMHNLNENDEVRNSLTFTEVATIEKLQASNASLIELGFSFNDRKKMLKKLAGIKRRLKP